LVESCLFFGSPLYRRTDVRKLGKIKGRIKA